MKKPMKKIKPLRFAEGGSTDEDALKSKGLEESNKEAPVGFFKRLRMGNIDDPSSEAYKQFGAGRGRSVSVAPTPVNQIKDEDSFAPVIKNAAVNDDGQVLETANKGEDLAISLRDENIQKRMRDADSAPPVKKQAAPTAARENGQGGSAKPPYSNEGRNSKLASGSIQRGRGGPTADEFDRYAAELKAKRDATYRNAIDVLANPEAKPPYSNEGKNSKTFTSYREGGQVKKMASGGSVSSRGDGIAQRGKTRGKMC